MITFTKEQNDILKAQADEILKNISEGQSTRDIIAQIYVESLEDKTIKQGQIMADAILKNVREFDADYKEAQENLDRFIRKFQDKMDAGKTCAERCNYWLKLGAAISSATIVMVDENVDREEILREIETMEISESEATPEREKELREQAAEAIKNSGVMLGALVNQTKALEEMENADEVAGMLIDLGNKEVEYRAIVAMLAYTKVKNGEFDDVPVEMTAAQITTLVCAEIEQVKIMEAVGKGELAVDIASALLSVLGAVVLTYVSCVISLTGITFITATFGSVLTIPAALMLVAGLTRFMSRAMEMWDEDNRKIVKCVAVAVKAVIKGFKMVVSYVRENIIPHAVAICKSIKEKIQNLGSNKKEKVQVSVE